MDKNDEIKDYVFGFECSVGWENLEKTEDEDRRFCRRCDRNVYFAGTQTQLNKLAMKGNCVAFPTPNVPPERFTPVLAGYILPPFYDCKLCKKRIERKGGADSGDDVCPECRKSNAGRKKSWWRFWK